MNRKAFTLIEILVVISVLIILIGVAIPRIRGMQDAGNIARAKGELQTIQTAVESYYINQTLKVYPPTTTTIGTSFLTGATPAIISTTPPYDPWGSTTTTEYNYYRNGSYYIISSVGPDSLGSTETVSSTGVVTGKAVAVNVDDLCVSNGTGC